VAPVSLGGNAPKKMYQDRPAAISFNIPRRMIPLDMKKINSRDQSHSPSSPVSPLSPFGSRTSINKASGKLREIMYINPPSSIDDFYDFGRVLGRGGFGVVSEILHAKTFQSFAGKALKKSTIKSDEDETIFRKVIELLLNTQCMHIVKLVHIFEDEYNYYTVMPKCHGNLARLIRNGKETRTSPILSSDRIRNFCKQILGGVGFLHSHNVLHRDIKPGNIMIEERFLENEEDFGGQPMTVKILDFDMCIILDPNEDSLRINHLIGTACYMAPEIYETSIYSKQSDIFAVGGTLYFLVEESDPCPGISLSPCHETRELSTWMSQWVEETCRMMETVESNSAWERLPKEAIEFIRSSLARYTKDRWNSVEEMMNSEWLFTFDGRRL